MTPEQTLTEMQADGLAEHKEAINEMYIAWLELNSDACTKLKSKIKLTHYRLIELVGGN